MAKRNGASGVKIQGKVILDTLSAILERCEKGKARLSYPGEGGERRFRGWLVSDLLREVFNWPADKIVVGERFDILLQDRDDFPVINIETKTPNHKASKKEREDFEGRLSSYGTLRSAYFTNGTEWERLDIFSPQGELVIRDRRNFNLDNAKEEEAEDFFRPLTMLRDSAALREGRLRVSKEDPYILELLAAHLI